MRSRSVHSRILGGAVVVGLAAATIVVLPASAQASVRDDWYTSPATLPATSQSAPVFIAGVEDTGGIWVTDNTGIGVTSFDSGPGSQIIGERTGYTLSSPQLAVTDDGAMIATWIQAETIGGTQQVVIATSERPDNNQEREWDDPEVISTNGSNTVAHPSVALDNNDTATVVWEETDGSQTYIAENNYDGNAWLATSIPLTITTDTLANYVTPIVTAAGDQFVVTYARVALTGTDSNEIDAVAIDSVNTFSTPQTLSSVTTVSSNYSVAHTAAGQVSVLWGEFSTSGGQHWTLHTNTYSPSTSTWGTDASPFAVATEFFDASVPLPSDLQLQLSSSSLGNLAAVAVSLSTDSSTRTVSYSSAKVGLPWSTPVIPASSTGDVRAPSVAISDEGDAAATWTEWSGGNSQIYFARLPDGGGAPVNTTSLMGDPNNGDEGDNSTILQIYGAFGVVWHFASNQGEEIKASWVAQVPNPATALTAEPGDTQVTVSWVAPVEGPTPDGYTVTASPGGQSCNPSSGETSCTVTGLDNDTAYTFTVIATYRGEDSDPATIGSTPVGVPVIVSPVFTSTLATTATVDAAYSSTVTASGTAPIIFAVTEGTLPDGLTLVSGVLSGTPTTAGSYTFTITASNGGTDATQETTIVVAAADLPARLPNTGSDSTAPVGIAALLLLLGAAVTIVARRRRTA